MGHYCGFGPSVGQYGTSGYASNFPQFIGTNGTSKNWDYGGWHNSVYRNCHQQLYAAGISPGSGYDHVQRPYTNDFTASEDPDNSYWNIHTYQMPDHVQETCSTDFTRSDGSDDCYWSVHNFPVSVTKPHVSHSQPSIPDGTVDDSMIVPRTTESHEMKVHKVLNPVPEVQTVECVPPGQQSQLYEKNANSTTHDNIWEQMKEEIAEYLTKSKQNEQEAQRKHEEEDPESGAIVETIVGLDPFCDDAFELFDPGIDTSEQQFSYALPVQYLQQLQQHKTCQPVVSADCALLANNPIMSLQSLQLSKLLVNEFEGSADCANQLVIPGDIHNTTVNSLSQEIFYIGKPPIRYSGFIMPLSEEQQVIPVKGTCASATVPVPTRHEGCEIKHGLLLLHYSTPKDKPLLSWDPGEHEIFVRFSNTSAATHRQKLLMLAGNWDFMNLEEFKGSGDYTYTGYQPQARRICSSYSLAGSLDRHMYCGIVLLDIFFQQFLADTYQVSTSQLMVCQHVHILVTNHCRSAPYFPWDSNKYPNYQILLPPSIIHCDAALVRCLYNLIVNLTHLILDWCASRLTQALHSPGEHSSGCDNSCNCSLIILQWVTASPSDVLYLHTYTLSLFKSVAYLLINLLSKGVLMVSILYSCIVLQVLQTTYISLLDMNAQGDFHATNCYRLCLHEFSATIFALFKVCINIWSSADTRARELTGNVVDTYSRLFATALLQVEMCIVLDFLQIFDSIVHVLYITKVEKSPTAQNEQVRMGKIAKYMHWNQCSDFIYLKDFLMNNDSSLRWFPSSKRTFSQWDPGIEVSMHIHKILNCSTTRVFKWNQVLVKESIAHASICFKCKTTGCPTDSIVWGHTETSTDLKQTRYYELLMSKLLAMWLLLLQYLRFWEIHGWLVTYQPP